MIRHTLSILFFLVLLSLVAQGNRSLQDFSGITVQEGIKVILTKGERPMAEVEVKGKLTPEAVVTEVSGDVLKIYLEGDKRKDVTVQVRVTYIELESIRASSAAQVRVTGAVQVRENFSIKCSSAASIEMELSTQDVALEISSSGKVDLTLIAEEVFIEVSSAGALTVKGSANEVNAKTSSSATINGYDLICKEANITSSSGSKVSLTVNESLQASASSGGFIEYKGTADVREAKTSSGGSVKKM